jgi:hypothetical protein
LLVSDIPHEKVHFFDAEPSPPSELGSVDVGGMPYWFEFNAQGSTAYGSLFDRDEVLAIDVVNRNIGARVNTLSKPKRVHVVSVPELHLVDDFSNGALTTTYGAAWEVRKTPGATAEVSTLLLGAAGTKGAVRLTGRVPFHPDPDNNNGAAGLWSYLRSDKRPVDLSHAKGVRFYARGLPGSVISFQLKTGEGTPPYSFVLTLSDSWTPYTVPFALMSRAFLTNAEPSWEGQPVQSWGFVVDRPRDQFSFELDEIVVY